MSFAMIFLYHKTLSDTWYLNHAQFEWDLELQAVLLNDKGDLDGSDRTIGQDSYNLSDWTLFVHGDQSFQHKLFRQGSVRDLFISTFEFSWKT